MPAPLSVVLPVRAQTELVLANVERLATANTSIQLVVVENGSQELDIDRLRRRAGHHDLILLHRPEPDLSAARNVGLRAATGRFVLFLDADDIIDIAAVLDLVGDVDQRADVVHVRMRRLTDPGATASAEPMQPHVARSEQDPPTIAVMRGSEFLLREVLTNRYSPVTGAYLFRRDWLLGLDLEFTPGFLHEDHAFVTRAVASADRVVASSEAAFLKRERDDSIMRTISIEDSIAGYARAIEDLRAPSGATDRGPGARIAVVAVNVRLDQVLARKQLRRDRAEAGRTVILRRGARVLSASVRFVAMTLLVALALAGGRAAAASGALRSGVDGLIGVQRRGRPHE